jgi:hypothetical protein
VGELLAHLESDSEVRRNAGGLEPPALDYLEIDADIGPHGPGTVAKALGRSSSGG